jgi:hypothetical protein
VTNGPAYFQCFIKNVMAEYLDDIMTVFVDDILIYSQKESEHQELVKVLGQLRGAGPQAALYRCEFGVTRTKFLGFIISTDGVEVDPAKIQTILDWVVPTTIRGSATSTGSFIKNYRTIA